MPGNWLMRLRLLTCREKNAHDECAVFSVKVPCRLVGDDHLGFVQQGTCNADALLFAARKFVGELMFDSFKSYEREYFGNASGT